MVLIRRSAVLGFVLLGGCSNSLFGAHGAAQGGDASDDGGGSGVVGCGDPCSADAASEFDGTLHGLHDRWRYLDDNRDRSWTPMTVGDQVMTGTDSRNHITTCAARPGAPACTPLPGALLVSSAGITSTADPAIELTVAAAQVMELDLKAFVPNGEADQTIRLYRNSREDVLFTGIATVGVPLVHMITLDALPGDRFLVAVAPISNGATDVGLQLVASATGATFPSSCKLALSFTSATGNTIQDLCGGPTLNYYTSMPTKTGKQPLLTSWPFAEMGNAATIHAGEYFERGMDSLQLFRWPNEFTVQFWFRVNQVAPVQFNSIFSDWDANNCGGVGIEISPVTPPELDVHMCKDMSQNKDADMVSPLDPKAGWQFVRVVRSSIGSVCLNGSLIQSTSILPAQGVTGNLLSLGREDSQPTTGAFFDGQIDDVRVIAGALPCN